MSEMKFFRHVLTLAAAATLGPVASAMDLMQAWQGALDHAPDMAVAQAVRDAGAAQARQADALWRPSATLEGSAAYANSQTQTQGAQFATPALGQSGGVAFDTSINGGTATRYALALRQPLYSRERSARSAALEIGAQSSELEWAQARQDLMLHTAEAYFNAALAAERVRVVRRQQESVDRAAAEARERFRLGDRPVTDVHEAEARAASLQAQGLAADAQWQLARDALADLTGPAGDDRSLAVPVEPGDGEPGTLADWVDRAQRQNYRLLLAQSQLQVAEAREQASGAVFSPTVDVVAQVARDDISGNGNYGSASYSAVNSSIGVQLAIPIFTGGLRTAQHDESQALVNRAHAEIDRARLQIVQETRAAWLDLSLGRSRLAALQAALDSGLARLDATRIGLRAGDRTTLNLIDAENDAATAELALLEARVQLLNRQLRLAALVGELNDPTLQRVNTQLRSISH